MTEIVFAPLDDSPHEQGDAIARLPALRVVAYESAGAHAVARLPALQVSATGFEREMGAAILTLPPLGVRGFESGDGHAIAILPPLRVRARDASDLVPNSGMAQLTLPALQVMATGFEGLWGNAVLVLPRIGLRALEAAGNNAIVNLPRLHVAAFDDIAVPANRFSLQQSPGYLYAYFANPLTPELLSEGVATDETLRTVMPFVANEHTAVAASAIARQAANLVEGVQAKALAVSTAHMVSSATESLSLLDVATVVMQFIVVEAVDVNAIGTLSRRQIIAAVEYLQATALASSQLHAVQAVVETLVVAELERHGWREEHVESVEFSAALVQLHQQIEALVESVVMDDTLNESMRFTMTFAEGVVVDDSATSVAHFFELLTESIAATAVFRIAGEPYVAWAINIDNEAASHYDNFGFNSFAEFPADSGNYYGLMHDGLYAIGGPDDDGAKINMAIRSGLDNFGSAFIKGMGLAYVGLRTDGEVVLKLITTSEGRKEVFWYKLEGRTGDAIREDRLKPDQGPESVYWQWEMINLDGADVQFDCIRLVPLLTSRRV